MKTASGLQFCASRGRNSPRSRMSTRAPVPASARASVPPPIPEPMMTMSGECIAVESRFSLSRLVGAEEFVERLAEEVLAPHHALVDAEAEAFVVAAVLE